MRIVFMGTPEFAVPTLNALIESPHEVVGVVTQPDKPVGRGKKLRAPAVKAAVEEAGLPVFQPEKIKSPKKGESGGKAMRPEVAAQLAEWEPDVIVVVAYGQILPLDLLELPPHGCLNVHASLLPKFRGAAPINWAIARGETETGVSIMQMDEGLDTGDVLAMDRMEILADDDAQSVSDALSVMGAALLLDVLGQIEAGEPPEPQPQAEMNDEPSYAPLMKKEDGRIDWRLSSEEIICHINGFTPWPGTYAVLDEETGKTMKILAAEPFPYEVKSDNDDREPGEVLDLEKGRGFVVKTGSGYLLITKVQPQNKQAMDAWSACNGGYVDESVIFL